MQYPHEIQEHLLNIRTMVERATVYRILSAVSAIVGGIIAIVVGIWTSIIFNKAEFDDFAVGAWLSAWLFTLFIVCCVNTGIIVKKSKKEQRPVFSSGLKQALKSMIPACVAGAVIGLAILKLDRNYLPLTAAIWLACYGLALLSMSAFSPASLRNLGIGCLALGLASLLIYIRHFGAAFNPLHLANFFMVLGFGALHLIYGFGVMLLNKR